MNAYRFGIILSFLSVVCVCDKNVSNGSPMADLAPKVMFDDECMEEYCNECHDEGDDCSGCCGSTRLECYYGICRRCNDDYRVCGTADYEDASQISLSIAMALGVIVLLVVLWKMCFYDKMSPFRRYSRRARARMTANDNTPRSEDVTRASASSIQIRIVARLQNRPPPYESTCNYNQRVEAAKQQSVIDEAPPAYDAVEENVQIGLPPPYTIELDASNRQGIDNNSFVADEPFSGNINTTNVGIATNTGLNTENAAGPRNNRSVIINCETIHI